MPTARKLLAGLALALTAISCSDDRSPTAPTDQTLAPPTAPKTKQPLIGNLTTPETYTSTGGQFAAVGQQFVVTGVRITHFSYVDGQLLVDGILQDANGDIDHSQFTNAPATLNGEGGTTAPVCPILDLDIGEINLELLGLVVNLAPVHLTITAESGSGNLLGNLLCALVGLLDGPGPLAGLLDAIQNLLNQINAILMGL